MVFTGRRHFRHQVGAMALKPGQRFCALSRSVKVGFRFEDDGLSVEVVRVLTEREIKTEVPEFHLAMRAMLPDEELCWVECRSLVH